MKVFLHGALQIAANGDCVASVAQPVAKDIVTCFGKLLKVSEGGVTHSIVSDSALFSVVKALVAELAALKLGVSAQPDDLSMPAVEDELSQRGEALVKAASKVFGGNLQKLVGPGVVWVKAHLQKLPAPEVQDVADEAPIRFVPGTLVMTRSGTKKQMFDQKRGEVVRGGAHPHVKILEGEAKGTTKPFSTDKLVLWAESSAKEQTPLAAAAGVGLAALPQVPKASDEDAKAARAASLFGKPAPAN